MKCPVCNHQDTKVIDSRVVNDNLSIRRRRECLECGFRFSTYEEIEILDLSIVKRDGRKENYSREKLKCGLKRSLEKRPMSEDGIKKLISTIERDLQALKKSELPSFQVGQVVMKHLKEVDKIAFIRFASVYQSFDDVKTFQLELNKLLEDKKEEKVKNNK